MSRHEIISYGEGTRIKTVVGWDAMLQTFFLHQGEVDRDGEWLGEAPTLWLGTRWQQIPTLHELALHDWQHGVHILTSELLDALRKEQHYRD